MGAERRRRAVLAVLLVVLAVAGYRAWRAAVTVPPTAVPGTAASNRGAARRPQAAGPKTGVPDVKLETLEAERPAPGASQRNVFEFQQAPPPAAQIQPPDLTPPVESPGPPPVSTVPPIALKFIGIIEVPDERGKIAVLSDARGVYHGREGEIVEGRYRILKIGTESIEIAQLDGGSRQTIRLSGS